MGTNSIPAGSPVPWSAQLYHHETAGKKAVPGAVLEAIPRLQSAALPPAPELLDVEDPDALVDAGPPEPVDADVVVEEVTPDEAWPPAPVPVDPEVVDPEALDEVAPDDRPPPAPALLDVECAELHAMLPAMMQNPQTLGSCMTFSPS
jgi:hypothetical protein